MSSSGVAAAPRQIRKPAHDLDQRIGVAQRGHHLLVEHGALLRVARGGKSTNVTSA